MSLFEQSLINNYVFSENLENQIAGGAPITELVASQSVQQGVLGGGGGHESSVLSNKKHLSVPVGLVMMSHTEYVYPNQQRFCNRDVQESLFDNLIDIVREPLESPVIKRAKSLKHRGEVPKKQTKRVKIAGVNDTTKIKK
jgi:hypothetical protein